ncbi:MAG: response regulator transcription factor [Rhizobiaceae bacterium]
MPHILVVDDDPHIAEVIGFALDKAGHTYQVAGDGTQALAKFDSGKVDLIILDVGLPEMDGLEVCRQIRKSSEVPILFLSARDDEIDRILGLELGGDDYVTKPFSPRELMARISVILKRAAGRQIGIPDIDDCLSVGKLAMLRSERTVTFNGNAVCLTALEFNILETLMTRPRMVSSRVQILDRAYPDNFNVSDRTIDSHIRNVREKLRKQGCMDSIETVHGAGFRMGGCIN